MKIEDFEIFRTLISEVYDRAFGINLLPDILSEREAIHLAEQIEEATDRTISEKTLRTYVKQVTQTAIPPEQFSPSPFHLETLARFLFLEEHTVGREKNEKACPTWFKYKQNWHLRNRFATKGIPEAVSESVEISTGNSSKLLDWNINWLKKTNVRKWLAALAILLVFLWVLWIGSNVVPKGEMESFEFQNKVGANGWAETDFYIKKGDEVEITASGSWAIWDGHLDVWPFTGPEGYIDELNIIKKSGWDSYSMKKWLPNRDALHGALIGRIGENPSFIIGSKLYFKSGYSGELCFCCNDFDQNNIGSMDVRVTIKRK